MKLYYFSEMPHHEYSDAESEKYPSLRLEFPNTYFNREKAHANYRRYLDEYEYADEVGFDGLMINEHHSTPSCVDVSVNMTAGILARTTKRAKILLMGNILPIQENPIQIAEQIAMADLISGGRVISGFVRGIGVETWWSNSNPVHNRERFEECHPETAIWAGRRGYTYVPFLVPLPIARELFDYYRQGAAEASLEAGPDNLGFMICAVCADTRDKALEAGKHFVWRMGPTLRGPTEFLAPVGMRSRLGAQMALRARPASLSKMSYQELLDAGLIIAGTPDTLIERFTHIHEELGIGHLLLEAQESRMDHPTTMRSIELIAKEVIPALAAL